MPKMVFPWRALRVIALLKPRPGPKISVDYRGNVSLEL